MASTPLSSATHGRAIVRGLFVAVALADLGLVALALSPNVSADYAAFFITRTSDCLLRPVDGQPGDFLASLTTAENDGRHVVACGMGGAEPNGTWTVGHHAALLLPAPPAGDVALVLHLTGTFLPRAGAVQRLQIIANGIPVGDATIDRSDAQVLTFAIPATARTGSGPLMIDLKLPDASAPRSWPGQGQDSRVLGIRLKAAGILPAAAATP